MNKREAALWYRERYHFHTIEVEPTTKKPVRDNWNEPVDEKDLNGFFEDDRLNVGVLLGVPFNLSDMDIDALEARYALIEYEIATGLVFGHRSKPASHRFYYSDPAPRSIKYNDPGAKEGQQACLIELRCLTRDGKIGYQTIVPPSTHISGEPIEFVGGAGWPANVEKEVIERAVRLTAAAAMMGRHAPPEGRCHEYVLAIAGALVRAGWPVEEVERFLRAVYRATWKEKARVDEANQNARSTYERFKNTGDCTGLRTLANMIDGRVLRTFKQWLGLERETREAAKKPRVLAKGVPLENLRHAEIRKIQEIVEKHISNDSVTLLVAPSRSGKTLLAMQIAMSLASGVPLFGWFKVSKAPCLFIEADDRRGKASLQDFVLRCRAANAGQALPLEVIYHDPDKPDDVIPNIGDPDFAGWLKAEILRTGAGLCVLDSYTSLRGLREGKDIVKLEGSDMTLLSEIAREMRCAIILIHHDSKTSAHLDIYSRAAGSFAMQQATESQIIITRIPQLHDGNPSRMVNVRGRHLDGHNMVISFRKTSLDYDFVLEGPAAAHYHHIHDLWEELPDIAFEIAEATKVIGQSQQTAYRVLKKIVRAGGVLVKNGKGWSWDFAFAKARKRAQMEAAEAARQNSDDFQT